jgi:hypothetical protein
VTALSPLKRFRINDPKAQDVGRGVGSLLKRLAVVMVLTRFGHLRAGLIGHGQILLYRGTYDPQSIKPPQHLK